MLSIGLFKVFITRRTITALFTGSIVKDTLIGNIFGSISAGNPITSYIIGGELLNKGVSLFAVTAFMISWVTVGIIQFPAESVILGRKFAVVRNIICFFLSLGSAVLVVLTLKLLG
ncbi:MAG: permease [Elusimicrobiota bacterium]